MTATTPRRAALPAPGPADRAGPGPAVGTTTAPAGSTAAAARPDDLAGSPRLRLLVVAPGGVLGGAEAWLLTLLDATDRADVRALVLGDGPLVAELRRRDVPVAVLDVGRRGIDVARSWPALHRYLRAADPDVVLANGVKAQSVVGPVAAATGVPSVWVKHDHSHDARLAPLLGRLAGRVVATAEEVGAATGRPDVVVVPPPAPPAPLGRDEARALLAPLVALGTAPVLAMATRLVPYKGVDTAVRALATAGGRAWHLLVLGESDPATPDERERLAGLARTLGVADRVHLVGHVPDAPRLLRAADAVAVLTRPDGPRTPGREGFSMAGFEAMAAGLPVVAVDDGGPGARRVGHDAGELVPADDTAAVGRALARLADPAVRRAAGAVGRARTAGHPDAATCADDLLAVLARTARRPGAGLAPRTPVSVVTTVLDEADGTERLLARLVPQLGPDDEVVVVDGGSRDGTAGRVAEVAAADPRVRLLVVPGAGISAGRNAGVRAAAHDRLACTDVGCEPDDGWLAALRAAADERGAADLVTGVYRATSAPGRPDQDAMAVVGYPEPAEARRPTPLVRAYGRLLGRVYDPTLPTGRSMSFDRAAWAAAGGFPEHLQAGEDVLFGRAVVRAGGRAELAVDALVRWRQRPTLRATLRMYRTYGRGGGLSGSPLLVGRDLVRAAALVGGPVLALRVPAARPLVLGAATASVSLPLLRARRRRYPVLVAALVPAAAAARDAAKAWGCLGGLAARARHGRARTP